MSYVCPQQHRNSDQWSEHFENGCARCEVMKLEMIIEGFKEMWPDEWADFVTIVHKGIDPYGDEEETA